MAYYINRRYGSWRIIFRETLNGKRVCKHLSVEASATLGFQAGWTLDQVRAHVEMLNAQAHIVKEENKKKLRTLAVVTSRRQRNSAHLTEPKVLEFEAHLATRYRKAFQIKNQLDRWSTAQKIIQELNLNTEQAYFRRNEIWGWFIKRSHSLDYCTKVLALLNRWGEFLNSHYIKIPTPDKFIRSEMHEAYLNSERFRGGSAPITWEMLAKAQNKLKPSQYNWLALSVWFGLRPEEIDAKKTREFVERGVRVISVYQSKLVSVAPEDRWKHIPLLYPEQVQAVDRWKHAARPLVKTLKALFGDNVRLYGGRKGFHQLMSARGHNDDVIATWLGHQSLDTLRKHYIDRKKVRF